MFRVFNRQMQSFEKFRMVCITQRSASAKWNFFLHTFLGVYFFAHMHM